MSDRSHGQGAGGSESQVAPDLLADEERSAPPAYLALDISAHTSGEDVLLAIRTARYEAEESVIVALSPNRARQLYEAGELKGWMPEGGSDRDE